MLFFTASGNYVALQVDAGEWDQYEIDFTDHLYPLIEDLLAGKDIKRVLVPGCGSSKIPRQVVHFHSFAI